VFLIVPPWLHAQHSDYWNTRLHPSCLNPVTRTAILLPLRQSDNAANCVNASDSSLRASVCGVITKSLARSFTWCRCEQATEVEEGQRRQSFEPYRTCVWRYHSSEHCVSMIIHCFQISVHGFDKLAATGLEITDSWICFICKYFNYRFHVFYFVASSSSYILCYCIYCVICVYCVIVYIMLLYILCYCTYCVIVYIVLLYILCYCICCVIVYIVLLYILCYCICCVIVYIVLLYILCYCIGFVIVYIVLLYMLCYCVCCVIVHIVLLYILCYCIRKCFPQQSSVQVFLIT